MGEQIELSDKDEEIQKDNSVNGFASINQVNAQCLLLHAIITWNSNFSVTAPEGCLILICPAFDVKISIIMCLEIKNTAVSVSLTFCIVIANPTRLDDFVR